MSIKISVVVPTWCRPQLLEKGLDALRNQHFAKNEFEIIVVSDGHDKATESAIKPYLDHDLPAIHYYSLPDKRGPAAARNNGWKKAKGKFIAFTDDDCIPDVHWLARLWETYEKEHEPVAAYAGRIIVPIQDSPTDYELNIQRLEEAEFVTANCACAKAALELIGGFDEQFSMAWREDSDLHFRLLQSGIPIRHIEEAIVVHPVRTASWGVSIKEQKKSMFNALLYKKYPKLYREKIQQQSPWLYYIIVLAFFSFLISLLYKESLLQYLSLTVWLVSTGVFILKRLSATSRSWKHITEMVCTSFIIPFLSLYWRFYGAFKYRTFFI